MENTLEAKKLRILKRLETTIESSNSIIYEINQELESIVESNKALVDMADTYNLWITKE